MLFSFIFLLIQLFISAQIKHVKYFETILNIIYTVAKSKTKHIQFNHKVIANKNEYKYFIIIVFFSTYV